MRKITYKKAAAVAMAAALSAALLVGCGSTAAIDPTAFGDVDIWLDGTPSMAGFVAGDLATTYRKTLPRVEETAYNTWINANVNYYRFEISMLPEDFADISGMDDYLAGSGQTLEEMTRELVEIALRRVHGNQSQAAVQLGVSRSTLWRMLHKEK